jgi:hypothetical protein
VVLEINPVPVPAAHQQRDAIVSAGNHQGQSAAHQSGDAIAAQGVAQKHRVVAGGIHAIDSFLKAGAHGRAAQGVETLGPEFEVHLVRRPRHRGAHLAVQHLARNQLQAHSLRARATATAAFSP